MGWVLGEVAGPASGQVKAAKVTIVNVTIGKPVELGFKLSKFSNLPAGTIEFKVKNVGYANHDFKLCTTPAATSAHNSCVGKATAVLKRGQSATLTMTIKKTGTYEYLCSVPGHASAGMKGLLGVGTKVAAPTIPVKSTTTTTTTTTPATTTTTTPATTTTTTPPTTTTTAGGGGGGGGGGGATGADGCPPGTTIVTAGFGGDGDDDDGGGPTDGDGCL